MRRFFLFLLIVALLPLTRVHAAPPAQSATPVPTTTPGALDEARQRAIATLQTLTPEERVGQLFLVTFSGTEAGPGSQIYDLITKYHIGGVILRRENDNFISTDSASGITASQAIQLNRQLQLARWEASQTTQTDPVSGEEFRPTFIPLFIGLSQEGDGYPFDQIINDLTPLPNSMALGATWNPGLSEQIGQILGSELSALGFNLLLGPVLDVLETATLGQSILGTRSFGGEPFWVGEMGKAYIQGVHQGSQGRMAIISKHFPGHGGSDRLPDEEVSTVRKTLEQLQSFELAPFFAVTGNAPSPLTTTDGLLTAHIRYQGFQGNIRATTRPVSFDPQALSLLMSLPPLASWRENGGVLVSDDLGSQAVRRFYELTSQPFDMPRRVALNAFLTGNDLLYVSDFSSGDLDSYNATQRTLEFFSQKYREDPAFAQRVDDSVTRILMLKYRLHEDFNLSRVVPSASNIPQAGENSQVTFEVARQAATLISPTQAELDDTIPDPPNENDRIVFISDTRVAKQCKQCPEQPILDERALEQTVLRRYGPQAGGQVAPNNLFSYTMDDVRDLLDSKQADTPLENNLKRANWLVFALLNNSLEHPSYLTLSRFLAERPDLFQQKRLILFALNAPYFLDPTNISKLTAYYGLYSKTDQFVDLAAYLLFQELPAVGDLPVSVPGVGYDINEAMFPDPNQVFPLELDLTTPQSPTGTITATVTPQPLSTPEFRIGDVIPVRAGVILDLNGNPVPDGTPVEFLLSAGSEVPVQRQVQTTVKGIAHSSFAINNSGTIEIVANSEPATSNVLRFDIPSPIDLGSPVPTIEQPTSSPPPPTRTETVPTPISTELPPPQPPKPIQFGDWIIAVLLASALAWITYRLFVSAGQPRWGLRTGMLALICSLLAYCYLALELPGSEAFLAGSVPRSVLIVTAIGGLLGILLAWFWRVIYKSSRRV